MPKLIDLSGEKYNRLTVISRVENKGKNTMWLCVCECGNKTIVSRNHLRSGHTKSCGCFRDELRKKVIHGMSHTKLYNVWSSIKDRTLNPNSEFYSHYGGRNITICDEWKNSFEIFYEWSMNNGYKEGLSVERIDNNGNYCPENCRFATPTEQSRNKRNNHIVEYKGKSKTIAEWSEITGLTRSCIECRLKRGWSIEDSLTIKNDRLKRNYKTILKEREQL